MPTVLRWRGYRFHFYSREPDEPPHVHVTKAGAQAKIWLSDCAVARSTGYPERELNELRRKVREHRDELLRSWHAISEKREADNRIATVRFDAERMYVHLQDGREISVPLWWYPRLLNATPEQRERWEILPFGDALHWPEIDEDLDVEGFLKGLKAPGAKQPEPA